MAELFEGHIATIALWAYRAEKKPLTDDQLTHLYTCNDCLALLGTCQLCNNIEEVLRVRIGQPKRSGIAS